MELSQFQFINPVSHNIILGALDDVLHPEQKLKYLVSKALIKPISRGWYLVNPNAENYSQMYAANVFYGPSYISMLTALSYLGLIADKTYTYESVCLNRGKILNNNIGRFVYYKQDVGSYYLGVTNIFLSPKISIQIASPTKALYDYLQHESNLNFTGKLDLYNFLADDLRFDMESLKKLDIELLKKLIYFGKKSRQINLLIKLIESQ